MCKVQLSNQTKAEVTWEKEDQLNAEFPDILFFDSSKSRGQDSS
jgi:hypothetical protein